MRTIQIGSRDIDVVLIEQKSTRELDNPITARLWFLTEKAGCLLRQMQQVELRCRIFRILQAKLFL